MCTEHLCNFNDREKTETLGESPVPLPLCHHKFHMDRPRIEPDIRR